jgi:endonuclease I
VNGAATREELVATGAAAKSAARAVEVDAALAAAWAEMWSAAGAAAGSAARAAAWDVWFDAAGDAAMSKERKWQSSHLLEMLEMLEL